MPSDLEHTYQANPSFPYYNYVLPNHYGQNFLNKETTVNSDFSYADNSYFLSWFLLRLYFFILGSLFTFVV